MPDRLTSPTPKPAPLQFGPALDVSAQSCAGANPAVRSENQDNYLLIDMKGQAAFLRGQIEQRVVVADWPAGHARIAVLDGMGGHGHARAAAEAVVEGLLAMPACASIEQLSTHLEALHGQLQDDFDDGAGNAKRPGTTLTLLELRPGKAALLWHVGDSRLYEIKDGKVVPMTVDHVPATAFAIGGLLGEQEWWQQVHGEHRSQISQAFILGNAFDDPSRLSDRLHELSAAMLPAYLQHLPDRRAVALDPHALYVLASDGFWACANPPVWLARWPALLAQYGSAERMCDALFTELLCEPPPGLQADNLTAIVLRPINRDETATPFPDGGRTMPHGK